MHDCFGVSFGPEDVAFRGQGRTQLDVVVDLAVECDPHRRVLVRHRLVAKRRHVDDREPPEPEAHARIFADEDALVVGSAVLEAIAHRHDRLRAHRRTVERQFTADAAHRRIGIVRQRYPYR